MKAIFKYLTGMVYPMLISLFLFIFTSSFLHGDFLEPMQALTMIMMVIFGVMFLVGLVGHIIFLNKETKK